MAIGAGIKFALNFVLLRVPQVGIAAAPIGSLACYLFIVAMSLRAICRETGVELSFRRPSASRLSPAACAG